MASTDQYEVRCGDTDVWIRKVGSREGRTGRILGRQQHADGRQTVWVDRLLLPPGPRTLNQAWTAEGAISTVLHGPTAMESGAGPPA